MPKRMTDAQLNAVNAEGSILVSAAAGSGKTSVLTARVIRKLTEEVDPVSADKLLIVTFTNAAALEMRMRIEKALLEKIAEQPHNDLFLKQYSLLGSANISTIDSFCINLVRENFEKCGVDRDFAVTNGGDMSEIYEAVMSEVIDGQFESQNQLFYRLLSFLDCEKDDKNLREYITEIYKKSNSVPFPEKFLEELKQTYLTPFDRNHIWYKSAFDILREHIAEMSENIEDIQALYPDVQGNAERLKEEVDFYSDIYGKLDSCLKNYNWDEVCSLVVGYHYRAYTLRDHSVAAEQYRHSRGEFRSAILDIRNYFFTYQTEIQRFLDKYSEAIVLLIDLVSEYSKKVLEAFIENNTLTFYHTEQIALKLLCDVSDDGSIAKTDIAREYIDKYDEVMVDEYQDVNDLQELMFEILSDDRKNLFVVGDVKQSIYRFRGSNPRNFMKKKEEYILFDGRQNVEHKKIILAENFRSRKCVCDFVNLVFENILNLETGQIDYNNEEILNPSAKFEQSDDESTDLIVVEKNTDSEDAYASEANAIADYIGKLIESKKQIKRGESTSDIRYGDICVLLESWKNAPVLAKTFSRFGIPVSFSSDDYCKTTEISLVLSLLNVIDNPLNSVDMLTVLLSPLFSFTPDDIAIIRKNNRKCKLYQAVLISAKNGNDKCKAFLDKLNELRKKSVIMPLRQLVSYLVYDTDIFAIVSSLDNSQHRCKNLYFLIELARSFKNGGAGDFVQYVRLLAEDRSNVADGDDNAVKIMTMHKSKGLQFPVCILADLSKEFNFNKEVYKKFIYSDKFGIAFQPFDEDLYEYVDNPGIQLAKKDLINSIVSEKIRLLYVAMTRAEEKLVLVTSLKELSGINKIAENLYDGHIPVSYVKGCKSLANLVLPVCLMHPDGDDLRKYLDDPIPLLETQSRMNVFIYTGGGLQAEPPKTFLSNEIEDPRLTELIKKNISFVYPNEVLSTISAKTSVSALAHSNDTGEFSFNDRPAFMNDKGASPTEKGTAVHRIMQFIDFEENIDLESEIARLTEWQFITEKEGEIADRDKLSAFFGSDVFKRIVASKRVEREWRFLTGVRAGEIYDVPDPVANREIIVQGAVDLLFFEEDGIVVLDFKTDRVSDASQLVELYSEQLRLYSAAVSKKFNMPVKEKIIYSFHLSKEIKLNS